MGEYLQVGREEYGAQDRPYRVRLTDEEVRELITQSVKDSTYGVGHNELERLVRATEAKITSNVTLI